MAKEKLLINVLVILPRNIEEFVAPVKSPLMLYLWKDNGTFEHFSILPALLEVTMPKGTASAQGQVNTNLNVKKYLGLLLNNWMKTEY